MRWPYCCCCCCCSSVGERRGEAVWGALHAGEAAGGSVEPSPAAAAVAAVGDAGEARGCAKPVALAASPGADCGGGSPWRKGQPPGTPGAVAAWLRLG